jgi:hypothetical protein
MNNLRTVRKPIAQAGTWKTSVGNGEITMAELEAVVAAQTDTAVPKTRVTLGHTVEASKNGAVRVPRPVMGHADNYALDGDTLFADFHLPGWLADEMERVTPGRSIEGLRSFETRDGTTHDMVIPVIALLSDELPAVETMDDFQNVVARTETAAPDLASDAVLVAASRLVVCAMPQSHDTKPAAPAAEPQDHPEEGAPMADQPNTQPEPTKAPDPQANGEQPKVDTPITDAPKADQPKTVPEPLKADATYEPPAGFKLVQEDQWDELQTKLGRFDDFLARQADTDAETFATELVAAGKIAPKSKDKIVAQYRENPASTKAVFEHVAATVPVGQLSTFSRHPHEPQQNDEMIPSLINLTPAEQARLDRLTPKGA